MMLHLSVVVEYYTPLVASVSSLIHTTGLGRNSLWAWLDWGPSGWLTTLLQFFDTVGWVLWPVKTVGRITYIVLVQTLNRARSINQSTLRDRLNVRRGIVCFQNTVTAHLVSWFIDWLIETFIQSQFTSLQSRTRSKSVLKPFVAAYWNLLWLRNWLCDGAYAVQLNGVEVGWILGMMLNMTNVVPVPTRIEPLSLTVFIVLIVLFAIFLVLSVAFLCHACKRRRLLYEVCVKLVLCE